MQNHAQKLAVFIQSLEGFEVIPTIDNNYDHIGATLVDGILQSGLNYNNVVKPRVEAVLTQYPDQKTTSSFLAVCARDGLKHILSWKDNRKPELIISLLFFLKEENIETCEQFSEWIHEEWNAAHLKKMKGIGPKTVDYFKILLGQDTIAVDVHLKRFVNLAGIDFSDYQQIKTLIMDTANQLNIQPSLLDHSIWKFMTERK